MTTTAIAGLASAMFIPGAAYAACSNNAPVTNDPAITCAAGTDALGVQGPAADNIVVDVQAGADVNGVVLGNNANVTVTGAIYSDDGLDIQNGSVTVNGGSIINDSAIALNVRNGGASTINLQSGSIEGVGTAMLIDDGGAVNIGSGANVVGEIVFTGSGTTSVTNAGTISDVNFGNTDATFELVTGSTVSGTVDAGAGANDTFVLGGAGAQSFNTGQIGTKYNNFDSFEKDGSGTWTLTGSNAQDWAVNAGTLVGTVATLNNVEVDTGATLEFQTGGTYAGDISGAGNVLKNGGAELILTGTNTFTGSLTVQNASILTVEDAAAFGNTSGVTIDFSTFRFGSDFSTDRDFTIGVNDASFDTQAFDNTISGNIGGAGSLVKVGTGTLTLTGTNTYGGNTLINAGTLIGDTDSLNGNVTNNGALVFDQGTNDTYGSQITGTGSVTKRGAGELILSASNNYSGATILEGGSIRVTNSSELGNGGAGNTLVFNGGELVVDSGLSMGRGVTMTGTGAVDTNANNVQFSGAITGSGDLTKTGSGRLYLSGNNSTYTGALIITDGTLAVNSGNALGSGAGTNTVTLMGTILRYEANLTQTQDVILDGGGEINTNSFDATISGDISGTGDFTKSGSGTLTLSGTNSYTGDTIIAAGGLTGTTSAILGNISNNGVLTFDQATTGTHNGDITGTGSLVIDGGGNVTLTGANTYSGGTTVTDGTLTGTTDSLQGDITNNGAVVFDQSTTATYTGVISGTGSLTIDGGGSITLGAANTYSGGTIVTDGTLIGTTTTLQGNITNNDAVIFDQAGNGTYAGDMSGSGALTIDGGGEITLTGSNSYSGGTTIANGTLIGDLDAIQGDVTNNGLLRLQGSGTLADVISGTGAVEIVGGGTVFLDNTNTYEGGTTVSGGSTLQISGDGSLGDTDGALNLDDGTILFAGNVFTGRDIILGAGDGTFDLNDFDGEISGEISGAGDLIVDGGLGTLTITNTNNSYANTTILSGRLVGTTDTIRGNITNNGTLSYDQATNATISGDMSGTGAIELTGSADFIFTGTNTYTGGTLVGGGSLTGDFAAIQGDIDNGAVVNLIDAVGGTYTGDLSGAGTFVFGGGGEYILTGTNNGHTGELQIIDGSRVQIADADAIGDGDIILDENAAFFFGDDMTLINNFIIGTSGGGNIDTNGNDVEISGDIGNVTPGTTITKNGLGKLTMSGNATYGTLVANAGEVEGTTSSLVGSIVNNSTVIFNQNTNGEYSGVMESLGDVVKEGSGTVLMSGNNTYEGNTTINDGILAVDNNASLGDGTGNIVIDDATLQFNDSATLVHDVVMTDTFSTFSALANTTGVLSGAISGAGNINKIGAGTISLTGNSAGFASFMDVSAGILAVNADFSGAWATVSNGGTLGGTGFLNVIEVNNGGRLAPGNSIGTLQVNSMTFASGSTYVVEVDHTGQSDLVDATGTITIDPGADVEVLVLAGTYAPQTNYTILQAASINGTFMGGVTSNAAFLDPELFYTGTQVNLTMTRNDVNFNETAADQGQSNTATAVEQLGAGNDVYEAVQTLSAADSQTAFNMLGGEQAASNGAVALQSSIAVQNSVVSRIQNIAFSRNASSVLSNLAPAAGGDDEDPATYTAALMEPSDASAAWNDTNVWLQAFGTTGHTDKRGSGDAQDRGSYGVIAGADKAVGKRTYIGAFAGWEMADVESDAVLSSSQINNYHAGLYATTTTNQNWTISGILNGMYHDVDSTRYVVFPGFSESITGDTSGGTVSTYLELARAYDMNGTAVEPFAALGATFTHIKGYSESGGAAALDVGTQNTFTPSSTIGVRAAHEFTSGDTVDVTLRGSIGWQHNYGDLDDESVMRFATGGVNNFTVYGPGRARDAAVIGAGVDIDFKNSGADAFVDYTGNASSQSHDHAITGGFKWKF